MDANASAKVEVLVFEDNPTDTPLLKDELLNVPELEVELTVVSRLAEGLDQLRKRHFDLALLDLNLPDCNGESTLKRLHDAVPLLPIIVVTGLNDNTLATAMLRNGAQDCLIKGRLAERMLAGTMRYAIERHQGRLELHQFDLYARRLEKSEASIRTVVETCADAILVIDQTGVIRFANPAAATLFGRPVHELMGEPFGFPTVASPLLEVDIRRMDGANCLVKLRINECFRDGDRAVLATLRDITERKRAKVLKEAPLRELADKNEQLERIIYTVSNDLKSPLITIRSFAGMVADDMANEHPERMGPDLERIERAAQRMNLLLEDLLHFSRLGRVLGSTVPVSLTEVADEARELVAGQLMNRGADVAIQPDLPVVVVERLRMVEVLQNLIESAVKFIGVNRLHELRLDANRWRMKSGSSFVTTESDWSPGFMNGSSGCSTSSTRNRREPGLVCRWSSGRSRCMAAGLGWNHPDRGWVRRFDSHWFPSPRTERKGKAARLTRGSIGIAVSPIPPLQPD